MFCKNFFYDSRARDMTITSSLLCLVNASFLPTKNRDFGGQIRRINLSYSAKFKLKYSQIGKTF